MCIHNALKTAANLRRLADEINSIIQKKAISNVREIVANTYKLGVTAALSHPILLRWENKYYHKLCADCKVIGQDMLQLANGNNTALSGYIQIKALPNHYTVCIETLLQGKNVVPVFVVTRRRL